MWSRRDFINRSSCCSPSLLYRVASWPKYNCRLCSGRKTIPSHVQAKTAHLNMEMLCFCVCIPDVCLYRVCAIDRFGCTGMLAKGILFPYLVTGWYERSICHPKNCTLCYLLKSSGSQDICHIHERNDLKWTNPASLFMVIVSKLVPLCVQGVQLTASAVRLVCELFNVQPFSNGFGTIDKSVEQRDAWSAERPHGSDRHAGAP